MMCGIVFGIILIIGFIIYSKYKHSCKDFLVWNSMACDWICKVCGKRSVDIDFDNE